MSEVHGEPTLASGSELIASPALLFQQGLGAPGQQRHPARLSLRMLCPYGMPPPFMRIIQVILKLLLNMDPRTKGHLRSTEWFGPANTRHPRPSCQDLPRPAQCIRQYLFLLRTPQGVGKSGQNTDHGAHVGY